ncbi:uncharacterized protein LOC107482911 isoform X1 [Arachis duranensis]|uniref:Uncharacterized protein LOC107482911 isoform X1 n=1 Tax=Arachis duranensis TaxID=130453 RepID=A0A6P5NDQ2_ARADU|nr:uncharacterized protein LOC107482911 isoform X1 [Arachis duranensis]
MSGVDAPAFLTWEERIICHERGNRVIHFYLKDSLGNSVLAVVGTERSVRHMMYVVPDHFLQTYGSAHSINACKWRARREVVEWLTCLVSRNHAPDSDVCVTGIELDDAAQALESLKLGNSAHKKTLPDKLMSRKLRFQSSDIEWSGVAWYCAKQLKHYPGFCRNGTTIYVHSFVYIMAEEENHYLGYLEDMYEDKKKQKKVKVRWFHHGREVKNVVPQLNLQEGEVFITPHVQVISAECVNGPAIVLTPKHYEKCVSAILHSSLSEIHICSRQFKNNKLKPFTLTKLRGYSNQSVLSFLGDPIVSKRKAKSHKLDTEDDEDFAQDNPLRSSNKRGKIPKGYQVLENGSSSLQNSALKKSEQKFPSLKLTLSRKTMGIKFVGPKPQHQLSFNVDDKVEFLCQDSGIRGCWFRCKILSATQRQLKVQYDDLMDADDIDKLEEWIPATRVAAPDKLGMRCSGRLTVRPFPPKDTTDHAFEIGTAVDAWWSDGWWEGVITGIDVGGVGTLQVYTPGEERLLTVQKKDIRISRDWVDNRWVDIAGKPNICSHLPSNVSSRVGLSANSAVVDGSVSGCSAILESKSSSIPKVEVAPKVEQELSGLEAPELESMKGVVTLGKPLAAIDEDEDIDSGDGGCDGETDNIDGDGKKALDTIDNEKDVSRGDAEKNDDGGDKVEKNNEGDLMLKEQHFDSAEQKLDAAEASCMNI